MAETWTDYFKEMGIKVIHALDIKTLERMEIVRDLRLGVFDVLVDQFREGIDVPEVSLVAISDADKEGFLRNERDLSRPLGVPPVTVKVMSSWAAGYPGPCNAIDEPPAVGKFRGSVTEEYGIVPQTIKERNCDLIAVTKVAKEEDSRHQ